MSSTFVVKPLGLNLRSEPEVRADTRLAVLNQGQEVTALGPKSNGWMRVSATVGGRSFEGWVSAAHLVVTGRSEEPERHTGVAPVHLAAHREARRDRDSRWAFPIGEGGAPRRNPDASPSQKARSLLKIVDWLDVEHSARYRPTSRSTYCNIYAYDYCFLAGVYLPRVWWMGGALVRLGRGEGVPVKYGDTVHEMNANALFDWLADFGPAYGWERLSPNDMTLMQERVNGGDVGIICAQRRELNKSGHICAVVPESPPGHQALRDGRTVRTPLQSQAGRTNLKLFTRVWWTGPQFRDFGFWVHR